MKLNELKQKIHIKAKDIEGLEDVEAEMLKKIKNT